MNIFSERLMKITAVQALGLSCVFAALYWMMFFDGGSAAKTALTNVESQKKAIAKEIKKLESSRSELEALKALSLSSAKSLNEFLNLVPRDPDISGAVGDMNDKAKEVGIKVEKYSLGRAEDIQLGFKRIGFDMDLSGYFKQSMYFLSAITQMTSRLVIVEGMTITTDKKVEESGQRALKIKAKFSTYAYEGDIL